MKLQVRVCDLQGRRRGVRRKCGPSSRMGPARVLCRRTWFKRDEQLNIPIMRLEIDFHGGRTGNERTAAYLLENMAILARREFIHVSWSPSPAEFTHSMYAHWRSQQPFDANA